MANAKVKVSIEEVMHLKSRLAEINELPLESIEWTSFGKVLNVSPQALDDWKFIGMCNTSFVEFGFHEEDYVSKIVVT